MGELSGRSTRSPPVWSSCETCSLRDLLLDTMHSRLCTTVRRDVIVPASSPCPTCFSTLPLWPVDAMATSPICIRLIARPSLVVEGAQIGLLLVVLLGTACIGICL